MLELICKNDRDVSLRCPDRRAVQINGYETQHTPTTDTAQLCDADPSRSEDVFSVSQTAGTIQQDCTFRNGDRSNCILTTSVIQRYFVRRELTDGYWVKVPKRILVKYTCSSKFEYLRKCQCLFSVILYNFIWKISAESGVERMDVTLWTVIGMIALAIGCQTK